MNCPNCGAANDADARFCAECGTPLENQDNEATIVGHSLKDIDDDAPVLASPDQIAAEDEKTVTVDQATLNNAQADQSPSPPQPEAAAPSPPPVTPASGGMDQGGTSVVGDTGGDSKRTMWIIVAIIVVVILCCCCFSIGIGGAIGSDPGVIEDIIDELSWLPLHLPLA